MDQSQRLITEVAAGILLDEQNRYLMGQRPIGKPYEGYWEFPGGKIEAGETIFDALKRELQEELGIDIKDSESLMLIEHDYPHAYVRIHVRIIREWSGEPTGLENQALSWQSLDSGRPAVEPLLPAAWPMIERLTQFLADTKNGRGSV